EPPCDPFARDGVDPVEALCDCPGLVRLDRPDVMPVEAQAGGERGTAVLLVERFLQVVFAELALTGLGQFEQAFGGNRLADRQQAYRLRGPAGGLAGLADAPPDRVERPPGG